MEGQISVPSTPGSKGFYPSFCRRLVPLIFVLIFMVIHTFDPASGQVHVLTYHNDPARTGQNTNEVILRPDNVNTNQFGKLFSYPVDGQVYAQLLYVSGLKVPGRGGRNVIYAATQHNSVYAFDADDSAPATGGLLWHVNLGPSASTPNQDFGNRYGPYHDIDPEVGITSTPVIDLASGTIYLDAFTHQGTNYLHQIHALNLTNGFEQPFSPVVVRASVPGTGVGSLDGEVVFDPEQQLQRPALTLAGGNLYVTFSGYADTDPYHGWIIGFDARTLIQLPSYVFNTTPNSSSAVFGANAGEGGIWMSGNGLAVDEQTNLFFEIGNGSFNADMAGGTEFGDSVVKLSTANSLSVADYFTPYNQAVLARDDTDLGSGGTLLLPDSVGSGTHKHLLVACGKEGTLYLLDRDSLGHFHAANDGQIVQSISNAVGGMWSSPAYFNDYLYVQGVNDVLKAFKFANGLLVTTPTSRSRTSFTFPSSTPAVSANGVNNAIVWLLQTDGYGDNKPSVLHAYDAYDVAHELYNSNLAGDRDNPGPTVKFTVPTIANGKVYVGTQGQVTVFGNGPFDANRPLSITRDGTEAVIQWVGTWTLEETSSLSEPWNDSTNQNSPQRVTSTATKFYRLRR